MLRTLLGVILSVTVVAQIPIGIRIVSGGSPSGEPAALLADTDIAPDPTCDYYDVQLNGLNSSYTQALTSRRVGGQLNFMSAEYTSDIPHRYVAEWTIGATSCHGTITTPIRTYDDIWAGDADEWVGTLDYVSLSWMESEQKLWSLNSIDYGDSGTFYDVHWYSRTLHDDGSVTNVHHNTLEGIPSKRIFGGCTPVPIWFQTAYSAPAFGCGFGGYTSLYAQASRPSLGPVLYLVPNLDSYTNATEIPDTDFFGVMDSVAATETNNDFYSDWVHRTSDRGSRLPGVVTNYIDGHDYSGTGASQPLTIGRDGRPDVSTVSTSGTTVTLTHEELGRDFSVCFVNWGVTGSCWWVGKTMLIDGDPYTVVSYTDTTHLEVTPSVGTKTDVDFQTPDTRPSFSAPADVKWQSPVPDGDGRWVWSDQMKAGVWINGTNKHGFIGFPTLNEGPTWYADARLAADSMIYEMHIWNPETFGEVKLGSRAIWNAKPASMTALSLSGRTPGGNDVVMHIEGPTFDPVTRRLYLMVPAKSDVYVGRMFVFLVDDSARPLPAAALVHLAHELERRDLTDPVWPTLGTVLAVAALGPIGRRSSRAA